MIAQSLEVVLRDHAFLEGLDASYVQLLSGCGRNTVFQAGEYLWREGEAADSFYLIRSGQVALEIYIPQKGALARRNRG